MRKYSCSLRTITEWNKLANECVNANKWYRLSKDCINANSVNMFKNKIDRCLIRVGTRR